MPMFDLTREQLKKAGIMGACVGFLKMPEAHEITTDSKAGVYIYRGGALVREKEIAIEEAFKL